MLKMQHYNFRISQASTLADGRRLTLVSRPTLTWSQKRYSATAACRRAHQHRPRRRGCQLHRSRPQSAGACSRNSLRSCERHDRNGRRAINGVPREDTLTVRYCGRLRSNPHDTLARQSVAADRARLPTVHQHDTRPTLLISSHLLTLRHAGVAILCIPVATIPCPLTVTARALACADLPSGLLSSPSPY